MRRHSRGYQLWLTLGGIILTLLLAAVITFGSLHIPFDPQQWSQVIVLYALSTFIVAALLVFGLILVRVLLRLWMERRAELLGSRFKTKMVIGAMSVSLLPLVFLFFVSYALMNRTLNRWFPHPLEIANVETQNLIHDVTGTNYLRLLAVARQATSQTSGSSIRRYRSECGNSGTAGHAAWRRRRMGGQFQRYRDAGQQFPCAGGQRSHVEAGARVARRFRDLDLAIGRFFGGSRRPGVAQSDRRLPKLPAVFSGQIHRYRNADECL